MKNIISVVLIIIIFSSLDGFSQKSCGVDIAKVANNFEGKDLEKSIGTVSNLYFDKGYKVTNAKTYTFKRTIKYKEPVVSLNVGTGYYGGVTVNQQPTNLHLCSLVENFKSGEPSLVATLISQSLDCSNGFLHGQVISYFQNSQIAYKKFYNVGKLQGEVIFYKENGTEDYRDYYETGVLIDDCRYSVSTDNPLLGTWKYLEYASNGLTFGGNVIVQPQVKRSLTITYYQNGINETKWQEYSQNGIIKRNWKFNPKNESTGILEEYLGDELTERGTIKWISKNQFEFSVTFQKDSNGIGDKFVFTRQ